MSQSWLAELPSSSPGRPTIQRTRSNSPQMPFTPGQPTRKTPTPAPRSSAPSSFSPLIDPSLRGQSVENTPATQESPATPPPAQRSSIGGKQPKRHFDEDDSASGTESGSSSSSDSDDSDDIPAKRRRVAQAMGEKLGLSERSIVDAKHFATVSSSLFLP